VIFQSLEPEAFIGILLALVIGITCHEFMHAFVADQLGDHRPRALGRVSLNPLAHIDPVGAIFFLLAGFGWGRPVPVNPSALRPGRVGMTYVALAGPLTNLVVATTFAVAFRAMDLAGLTFDFPFVASVLLFVVLFNVTLCFFNLIPIPPLDGYNVLLPLLPPRTAYTIQRYAQYGILVLLLLVVLPSYTGGGGPLSVLFDAASWVTRLLVGRLGA
jgi:Zn-dependent protease